LLSVVRLIICFVSGAVEKTFLFFMPLATANFKAIICSDIKTRRCNNVAANKSNIRNRNEKLIIKKDFKRLKKLYFEFMNFIKIIHSFYLDSLVGSRFLLKHIDKEQSYIQELFKNDADNANVFGKPIWDVKIFSHEHMFSRLGESSKSYGGHRMLQTTLGEVKDRNKPDGQHYLYLGNMCAVMLYSYWECYFRNALTKALGRTEDIEVPIWGDLRILRHIILHNKGKADSDVKKMEILKWYKVDDMIEISQEKFGKIIQLLYEFGNRIDYESIPRKSYSLPMLKHKT
jgi:hypothetical protein